MQKRTGLALDSAFIRQALKISEADSPPDRVYRAVSTDSRTVLPGDLFVALKGDNFDGHAYLRQALQNGAAAVVCEKKHAVDAGGQAFVVDDTLRAYRQIAGAWRRQFDIPVVAIAGAVGKTTTKEMLSAILRGRYAQVLKTEASENGFIGIPKTLLRLTGEHPIAVIEIGIDDVGAMIQHLELVEPRASLVTAIAEEHMENLKTLEQVANEEGQALTWVASRGGVVAINLDDKWIAPHAQSIGGRTLTYRLSKGGSGIAVNLQGRFEAERNELAVTGMFWQDVTFTVPLPGAHNAHNLLAAIALARALELDEKQIRAGLATFTPPYGRSSVKGLSGGPRVLCDFYNASPLSMRAGLKLVADLRRSDTRQVWACLGDMLELGERELDLHRELAEPIKEAGIDRILLYGPRMKQLAEAMPQARHFETHDALAESLLKEIKPQDVVLIKGSRGMRMEKIYAKLTEKFPEKAQS